MKQETANTFNEGLNYDLNPVVAPNNVLTDAVNGTYLTFNGNELSLQNDAGNIVINIQSTDYTIPTYDTTGATTYTVGQYVSTTSNTDRIRYWECVVSTNLSPLVNTNYWREFIVRLTPGYYPIGIKEYGGVLYIVSAMNIVNSSTIYQPGSTYYLNQSVQAGLNYIDSSTVVLNDFYVSLKYGNTADLSDATSWFHAGTIDTAPAYNMVEFGSYPSPEKYIYQPSIGTLSINVPKIIHNPTTANPTVVFSAGEYATFSSTIEQDYISRADTRLTPTNRIRFYNVRLLQQLTSGYTDLTDAINGAFTTYLMSSGAPTVHWLFDSNFKFYCPYLYKGKLALSMEIENMQLFTANINKITYDVNSNLYGIEIGVDIEFINNSYTIKADSVILSLSIGGIPLVLNTDYTITQSPTYNGTTSTVGTLIIAGIAGEYANELINYSIVPNFIYSGSSSGNADLGAEYLLKNTVSGSMILLAGNYEIFMKKDPTSWYNACSLTKPGYREYDVLYLVNESGQLVDMTFATSMFAYVMVKLGYVNPDIPIIAAATVIGYYTIDTNGIAHFDSWATDYVSPTDPIIIVDKPRVQAAVEGLPVVVADPTCVLVNLTITVTGNASTVISLFQIGMTFSPVTGHTMNTQVLAGTPVYVTITPADNSASVINDTISITTPTTYNYALINNIVMVANGAGKIAVWPSSYNLGNPLVSFIYGDLTSLTTTGLTTSPGILYNNVSLGQQVFSTLTYDPVVYPTTDIFTACTFAGNPAPIMNYKNLTDLTLYVQINGQVFNIYTSITT